MVFSSLEFIYIFLPLVLGLYFAALAIFENKKNIFSILNLVLLVSSLFFYIRGEKHFFWVMLLVGFIDYWLALMIERNRSSQRPSRSLQRIWLLVSIVSNMGLLFYFKYAQFAFKVILSFGLNRYIDERSTQFLAEVVLPIGISFYTFESMSYIIDVYLGHVRATRRFIDYWAFITFFPHLVAGPIIRYIDLKKQLEHRNHSLENIHEGFQRFAVGLGKKVIIANPLGYYADILFALDPTRIDWVLAWLAAIAYSLQIYFDFSGYSDMAIGLAKMFGIHLPENFNYPYVAQSMKDFWRRWHITLSQWFRDYLYIPLGGNKRGALFEYRNLLIVFILCGLWHGASWNFLAWGGFHGAFLIVERFKFWHRFSVPALLRHVYAVVVIIFSWVIFRAESVEQVVSMYWAMLGGNSLHVAHDAFKLLGTPHFFVFLILGALFCSPVVIVKMRGWFLKRNLISTFEVTGAVFLFFLSSIILCGHEYNPFIYFRF